MVDPTRSPRGLYILLMLLAAAAMVGISVIYLLQDDTGRTTLGIEVGKGLVQLVGIGIIGALVKFLFDDYQQRQRRAETLNEFRADKIRRLVLVTNTLRRAPILIDAHRSAKTYNEQMRALLDGGLELRLIRHEIEAAGPDANAAYPTWPDIRQRLDEMEKYLAWLQADFRNHSKEMSELQRAAEDDRRLQAQIWEKIQRIPSVCDMLEKSNTHLKSTRYYQYFASYETAIYLMVRASLLPDETGAGRG